MKEICKAVEAGALTSLLQAKPHLLRQADSLGDLPLHAACSARYQYAEQLHNMETIETLARHYPEALQTPNAHGMLPLHLACWFNESELIRRLVDLYPEALNTVDENGYAPLSFMIGKLAMSNETWEDSRELFEYLITLAPDSLWKVDEQGVLPLQYASLSEGGAGEQLLQLYLQATANSGGLRRLVNADNEQTPIHVAIASNTRMDIIKKIHEADPKAIRIPDKNGRLPIHQFISNEFLHQHKIYSQKKLEWLVQADPQAMAHQDNQGKTPLHILLENDSLFYKQDAEPQRNWDSPQAFSFLSSLLLAPRDATRQVDRNDWLQFATERLAAPSSCEKADLQGNLPLHLAVRNHSIDGEMAGLISALLQQHPGAILAKHHVGQTALEIGVSSQDCSLNTLFTLVNYNPYRVLQDYTMDN